MAAGTAIALGLGAAGTIASIMSSRAQAGDIEAGGEAAARQAEYDAQVALEEGRARALAIGAEGDRLADEQREVRAEQRVRAGASGGGLSASQNIMILAEQAQKMQMDQLELQRQEDIARTGAETEASLARFRGQSLLGLAQTRASNVKKAGIISGITGGVGTYLSAGGKTYLGKQAGKG